ncbi:MAG: chorismate synthase [Clostridia bacterium]|nr:chorismate synthase [Clostridia bacterium]
MKNTFGNHLCVTLFGESHGSCIGAVLDGIAPGIEIDEAYIRARLAQRRPTGAISTARREQDDFSIVSGVFEGKTTGAPLCILIPNADTNSKSYQKDILRPGHADFTAACKYHGYQDYRGGGHFSGRLTAPLVALGAIVQLALEQKGILIGSHISTLAGVRDAEFSDLEAGIRALNTKAFPTLCDEAGENMKEQIRLAAQAGDSVGGILESVILGLPAGLGEPWFDTVEGLLSHALFSIPAVKGVEFGAGFGFADLRGSQANDAFCIEDGRIRTVTNRNGGINGGITNGMPVLFRTVIKPTPSIFLEQDSVNPVTMEPQRLQIQGRHDPAIIHRARVVVDSVAALCIADLLVGRFGTDYLSSASAAGN